MKNIPLLAASLAFLCAGCASSEETPPPAVAPVQYVNLSLSKLIQFPATHLGQTVETQGLLISSPVEFKKGQLVFELTPDGGARTHRLQVLADARYFDALDSAFTQSIPIHVRGLMVQNSAVSAQHPILRLAALGVEGE